MFEFIFTQMAEAILSESPSCKLMVYIALACTEGMTLWNDAVVQLLWGITDKVPNVRMVAGNAFAMVMAVVEDPSQRAVVESQIVPALEQRLAEETDALTVAWPGSVGNKARV
jgi:hypothetical protein